MSIVFTRRALEHEDVVSYGEVVQATLGGGGQRLVEALLIISQTGVLTAGSQALRSRNLPDVHHEHPLADRGAGRLKLCSSSRRQASWPSHCRQTVPVPTPRACPCPVLMTELPAGVSVTETLTMILHLIARSHH